VRLAAMSELRAKRMVEVKIPRFDKLPEEGVVGNIPAVMGYWLTQLLTREQALLHAESLRPDEDVTLYLRPRREKTDGDDEAVVTVPRAVFISIVARMALMFEINFVDGGRGDSVVLFEERRFKCRVFLSRCKESGYWIRMYAQAGDEDLLASSDFVEVGGS
jgi:hypothetical protein